MIETFFFPIVELEMRLNMKEGRCIEERVKDSIFGSKTNGASSAPAPVIDLRPQEDSSP